MYLIPNPTKFLLVGKPSGFDSYLVMAHYTKAL